MKYIQFLSFASIPELASVIGLVIIKAVLVTRITQCLLQLRWMYEVMGKNELVSYFMGFCPPFCLPTYWCVYRLRAAMLKFPFLLQVVKTEVPELILLPLSRLLHFRELAPICSSRWTIQGFLYFFSWISWFALHPLTMFYAASCGITSRRKVWTSNWMGIKDWAFHKTFGEWWHELQFPNFFTTPHSAHPFVCFFGLYYFGVCHTHHCVLPSLGGFWRCSIKSVCQGSAWSGCQEKKPATCVPSPQPLYWQW